MEENGQKVLNVDGDINMKKITLFSLAALACFALSCQQGNKTDEKNNSGAHKQPEEAKEAQVPTPPYPGPTPRPDDGSTPGAPAPKPRPRY
ncbi:MAG: hypothetical protein JSR80_04330 [Verrucomicrobia bacterium]|nr:hypothetical protein [Verrucomicrobiota bacterium]